MVIIGGDGTFTGGKLFCEEYPINVVGIPGTIDNDISGTDFSIGYDTALNTVVSAIDKIRDTASAHNRLFFIEVMGRASGWLALNSGIGAGAEEILIPEKEQGAEAILHSLKKSRQSGKISSIVVVAEGNKIGSVFDLVEVLKPKLGPEYDMKVTVLGHIQRGGVPTCFDRVLASRLGVEAVEALLEGASSLMVGFKNNAIKRTPFSHVIGFKNELDPKLIKVAEIMAT